MIAATPYLAFPVIAAMCAAFLLLGVCIGLYGYARAEDAAFRRLLNAQQGRA